MASVTKKVIDKGKTLISKKLKQKPGGIKTIKLEKLPVSFVKPHMPVKKSKLTKEMKKDINKELEFMRPRLANATPDTLLSKLDTSMEGFFYKREFSVSNFNLLLRVYSHKGNIDECLGVIEKMKVLGLIPDVHSYVQLLTACGRARDCKTAELIFDKAKNALGDAPAILYSALMAAYSNIKDDETILRLINEKKDKGFVVNVVDYTCYMNCLIKAGKSQQAIDLYKTIHPHVEVNEYMLATVIKACTKLNEAEYALGIWETLKGSGFPPAPYFYNQIIKVLGRRKDYAEEALTIFRQMRGALIRPDHKTYNAVLTACSRLGDLSEARLALRDMKEFNIRLDEVKCSLLLSTYSEACYDANETAKETFIKESWEIFKICEENGWVTNAIITSLLSVHTKAYFNNQAEGLVLPLYQQYGIKKNMYAYRHLIEMYAQLSDFKAVNSLWDSMKKEEIKPDMYILNRYLYTSIKTHDTDRAYEALASFQENKYVPLYSYLKKLHQTKDLPLRIWAMLQDFETFYTSSLNKDYGNRLRLSEIEKRFTK